jgi:tetratricopeptide (TPR) repeat protein
VATDSPRILELRRRVQADPASIAFAQLAEELRRAGANDEAVDVCRAGLARHPGYLSARVTLGRALIEQGQLDEALAELETVSETAPDNLAAIRGLAEIHQLRGNLEEALRYYRRALELARHDPDLEETVERMEKEIAPRPSTPTELETSVEALFDFDRLVEQLEAETAGPVLPPPQPVEVPRTPAPPPNPPATSEALAAPNPSVPDSLATLEAALRNRDPLSPARPEEKGQETPTSDQRADAQIAELEDWLQTLRSDRS